MRDLLAKRATEIKTGLADRAAGKEVFTHVPTNLTSLDGPFGGLELGVQTLIVGHTGDGKTAFIQNLVRGAAERGFAALFFVLEDPGRKIADRHLSGELGVSSNLLGRLEVPKDVGPRLDAAVDRATWADHVGFHDGAVSPDDVLATVRHVAGRGGIGGRRLGLVAVDYAQGFSDAEAGLESVIARMTQNLNNLAKEFDMATLMGSQAKTEVLKRGRDRWERSGQEDVDGYRPGRGDAMWSARAEQYSKAYWALFRPGRWRKHLGDVGAKDDIMEVNIVKQNFGPEGQILLGWDGATARVFDRKVKP